MSLQRNALLLVLLTGVLGILGQWDTGLARLWCLPAALLLLGLAYERAAVRGGTVRVRLTGPPRWPLASERPVRFELAQEGRAQMTVQAALSAPETFAAEPRIATLSLPCGQGMPLELRATARRLGRFTWPAARLRLCGPLRLAWWPQQVTGEYTATVIPDLSVRPAGLFAEARGGRSATRQAGGGADIVQLREYRHGDPLRAIDWKASARRGHLISRDLSEERRLEILVALDVGRASALDAGEVDRLGLYVNVAARLAQRAAEFDDAVGLLLFAERPVTLLPPARGAAAVARIRGTLAECRVRPGQANPTLAAARIRASSPRRMLVVMLTDLLDAATEELGEAVKLLRPKHFTLLCGLENPRITALPAAPARDALDPFRALAAAEYHRTLAGNVRALHALGAAALTARPERLDGAVLAAYQRFRRERRV